METIISNRIVYFAQLHKKHLKALGYIRNRSHLQIAFDDDSIWIKGLTEEDIKHSDLLKIPNIDIFREQNAWLYKIESKLKHLPFPELIFLPIEQALSLEIEKYNHNFFGIKERIGINLVNSTKMEETQAILVEIELLLDFLQTNPAFRFRHLHWVIIDNKALVIGKPNIPLPGDAFWIFNNTLLPIGYSLEFESLGRILEQKLLKTISGYILFSHNLRVALPKTFIKELSLGSVRKTLKRA